MASGIDWNKSYWLSPEEVRQQEEMRKEKEDMDKFFQQQEDHKEKK